MDERSSLGMVIQNTEILPLPDVGWTSLLQTFSSVNVLFLLHTIRKGNVKSIRISYYKSYFVYFIVLYIHSTICWIFRVPFSQAYSIYFTWRRAIGNCAWTSVVIHSRNVSCTFSVSTRASIASLQNGSDRCMFCSNTQPPPAIESDIRRRACFSWPCPMDTDFRARNKQYIRFQQKSNSAYRYELWALVKD